MKVKIISVVLMVLFALSGCGYNTSSGNADVGGRSSKKSYAISEDMSAISRVDEAGNPDAFGKYPQTVVSDANVVSKLDELSGNPEATNHRIMSEELRIRLETEGTIQIHAWHSFANNYFQSTIRKWLHADFVETAFSKNERRYLIDTEIDNSAKVDTDGHDCTNIRLSLYSPNTNESVFLLSYYDVKNFIPDKELLKTSTDYAKCMGVFVSSNEGKGSPWWLRTPLVRDIGARGIAGGGYVNGDGANDCTTGVAPAVSITLNPQENSSGDRTALLSTEDGSVIRVIGDVPLSYVLDGYRSFVSQKDHSGIYLSPIEQYALYDLNSDGTPELFLLTAGRVDRFAVLAFKNGEIECIRQGLSGRIYDNGVVCFGFPSGMSMYQYSFFRFTDDLEFELLYNYCKWTSFEGDRYSEGDDFLDEDSPGVPYGEIEKRIDELIGGANEVRITFCDQSDLSAFDAYGED